VTILRQVSSENAAGIMLEDIMSRRTDRDTARRVVEDNKGLTLRDTSDPEYTIGNLIIHNVYGTMLDAESLTDIINEFSGKVYVPLGFVPVNEQIPEQITDQNIVEILCAYFPNLDDRQMTVMLGKKARQMFDQEYKKKNSAAPEDISEHCSHNPGSSEARSVDVSSCETVITPLNAETKQYR
jgi:hypothetical protein